MNDAAHIEWAGRQLTLLPQRAVWAPESADLLVADLHLGKAAAFRAFGTPVPSGTTRADLDRLSGLLQRFSPRRLVILGDLLHARAGRTPDTLETVSRWFEAHAGLPVLLVRGNHDLSAGDPPDGWNITPVDEPHADPLWPGAVLRHHPPDDRLRSKSLPALCGHLHPCVRLTGSGHTLRAPCFWLSRSLAVLPAYGSFTGQKTVHPAPTDRVFVVGDGQIVEAPSALSAARAGSRATPE